MLAGSISPSNSREDLLDVLADDVGEHIQPAAMRHADHDLVNVAVARRARAISSRIGDRGLARLPARSASGRRSASAGNARTLRRRSGCCRMRSARVAVERPVVGFRLHALLQPALLLRHLDIHVLAADLAAVGLRAASRESRAAWRPAWARLRRSLRQAAGEKFAVEIPDREPVGVAGRARR